LDVFGLTQYRYVVFEHTQAKRHAHLPINNDLYARVCVPVSFFHVFYFGSLYFGFNLFFAHLPRALLLPRYCFPASPSPRASPSSHHNTATRSAYCSTLNYFDSLRKISFGSFSSLFIVSFHTHATSLIIRNNKKYVVSFNPHKRHLFLCFVFFDFLS